MSKLATDNIVLIDPSGFPIVFSGDPNSAYVDVQGTTDRNPAWMEFYLDNAGPFPVSVVTGLIGPSQWTCTVQRPMMPADTCMFQVYAGYDGANPPYELVTGGTIVFLRIEVKPRARRFVRPESNPERSASESGKKRG